MQEKLSQAGEVKVMYPNLLGITLGMPVRYQSFSGTAYEKQAGVPWSKNDVQCSNRTNLTQAQMDKALDRLKKDGAPVQNSIFSIDSANENARFYTVHPIREACSLAK